MNSAAIETPVTEPMVMSTRLGGMVSVCAPVAERSATRSPGLAPRSFISGKQHRRHRRHVGGLGAGDARDQIHRADQHVREAAADMAEQAGQERHHRPRHAGHLDQQAEEDEQRHGEQDEVRHALVHAADHDHQRRAGGQRQIAEGREPERERDRHAGEDAAAATMPTKKMSRLRLPSPQQRAEARTAPR